MASDAPDVMDDSSQPLTSSASSPPFSFPSSSSSSSSANFSPASASFPSLTSSSSSSFSSPSMFTSAFPPASSAAASGQPEPLTSPAAFSSPTSSFSPFTSLTSDTSASGSFPLSSPLPQQPQSSSSSPPSASSTTPPARPLRAGTKRGSINRDEEEYEALDEGMERRPRKRRDYGLDDDDDDDGDEDDDDFGASARSVVSPEHKSSSLADEDEAADGADSFLNLLTHFAALHVPTSSTKPEQCPVCAAFFPLSSFADHVYVCLRSLDDVERKEQERLDEKMARQIMAREVRLLDQSERSASYARDRRDRGSDCPDGANCLRTDHQHFALRRHPEVACPVCSQLFAVYEINAHINLCLNDGSAAGGGGGAKRREKSAETGGKDDEMAEREDEDDREEERAMAAEEKDRGAEPPRLDVSSSAFSTVRGEKERRQRSDDDSHLPIAADSDDDDDKQPLPAQPSLSSSSATVVAAAAASSLSPSSSSDLRLTVEQASAVASHIIARKSRYEVTGGGSASDPSLLSLLETFATLGFTQENLSRLKNDQQRGGAAGGDDAAKDGKKDARDEMEGEGRGEERKA